MLNATVRNKIFYTLYVLFSVLIFFLITEYVSYNILKKEDKSFSLFYLKNITDNHTIDFMNECCGYNEVDPLLGWAMTKNQLKKRNLQTKHNNVYFENIIPNCKDTLIIYISGGSTSDVGLMDYNWPALFFKKLKEKKICVQLYVGAVGAYSSSQELLKFIRDGLPLQPAIHISYCGANEMENPYFVSQYEQNFYKKSFTETSKLFPNLIYLLKQKMHLNQKMILKPLPDFDAIGQWKRNMLVMNSLAISNKYSFYGILQPVAGVGNINKYNHDEKTLFHIKQYQLFYPLALEHLKKTNYLYNFTNIFEQVNEPFFDDCHVKEEYQRIVADSIMSLIEKKSDIQSYQ